MVGAIKPFPRKKITLTCWSFGPFTRHRRRLDFSIAFLVAYTQDSGPPSMAKTCGDWDDEFSDGSFWCRIVTLELMEISIFFGAPPLDKCLLQFQELIHWVCNFSTKHRHNFRQQWFYEGGCMDLQWNHTLPSSSTQSFCAKPHDVQMVMGSLGMIPRFVGDTGQGELDLLKFWLAIRGAPFRSFQVETVQRRSYTMYTYSPCLECMVKTCWDQAVSAVALPFLPCKLRVFRGVIRSDGQNNGKAGWTIVQLHFCYIYQR